MTKETIPAVSIIIPMYNAEKYIGECLASILAQTFSDYEVIVVDDCSKDNSCAVVESYLPKFNTKNNDKLKLIRSKVNSGSPGTPRNIGISFSRGEYIMFVDSDDAITETALDEIYPIAKKFNADVLHTEKCYKTQSDTLTTNKNLLKEDVLIPTDFVKVPTLMSDNPVTRLQIFINRNFDWTTWQNFVRRDFIIRNGIKFPNNKVQVDTIFSIFLLCLAEKIVRVPNIFYVYRSRVDSVSSRPDLAPADNRIKRWGQALLNSIVILDDFFNKVDFFKGHNEYRYAIFDALVKFIGDPVTNLYFKIPVPQLDDLIRAELAKIDGDTTALTAFLYGRMNFFNIKLAQQSRIIQQQQAQIKQLQAQLQQPQSPDDFTFSIS